MYSATKTHYRTHTCNELRLEHVGMSVTLSGFVHRIRDHGGLLFIDLRDHYGIVQCVVDQNNPIFGVAEKLKDETIICVSIWDWVQWLIIKGRQCKVHWIRYTTGVQILIQISIFKVSPARKHSIDRLSETG